MLGEWKLNPPQSQHLGFDQRSQLRRKEGLSLLVVHTQKRKPKAEKLPNVWLSQHKAPTPRAGTLFSNVMAPSTACRRFTAARFLSEQQAGPALQLMLIKPFPPPSVHLFNADLELR